MKFKLRMKIRYWKWLAKREAQMLAKFFADGFWTILAAFLWESVTYRECYYQHMEEEWRRAGRRLEFAEWLAAGGWKRPFGGEQ